MSLLLNLLIGHLTLLIIIAFLCRHFTGKVAWCDAVDADIGLLELSTHQLRQMYRGSFRRVVGEVALGVTHDAGHGRDGDDGG